MKIEAKGKINNNQITIVVTKKENGKCDYKISGCRLSRQLDILESLQYELGKRRLVAGTYSPPEEETDVNILNVLRFYLFDDVPKIEAEDIEPIPSEEGVVY